MITVSSMIARPKLPIQLIEEVERQEDRLGQPVEIAEIDGAIEARHADRILVAVEQRDFLGAGEEMLVDGELAPGATSCASPR